MKSKQERVKESRKQTVKKNSIKTVSKNISYEAKGGSVKNEYNVN